MDFVFHFYGFKAVCFFNEMEWRKYLQLGQQLCFWRLQKADEFVEKLEDKKVVNGTVSVKLKCVYSKVAKCRWFKNKLEIFQGPKYNFL